MRVASVTTVVEKYCLQVRLVYVHTISTVVYKSTAAKNIAQKAIFTEAAGRQPQVCNKKQSISTFTQLWMLNIVSVRAGS